MAQHSQSALARIGVTPWPIGTLEELVAEGLDPEAIASCAPSRPGITRGCPLWKACRFNLPRMGGFKGKGPKYVGYSLTTHEGDRKQDSMTCHSFVRTMQSRMDAGVVAKQQGRPYEIIRIVAQEGQMIRTRVGKKSTDKNEDGSYKYFYEVKEVPVPFHPRPADDERLNYDQELQAQDREAQEREDLLEAQMFPLPEPNAEPEEMTTTPPKRRGRPTNAEIAARKAVADPDPDPDDDGLGTE